MNKDVKKYLKNVKLLFPIFSKSERMYYQQLKDTLLKNYNNSAISYNDIVEKIGEPYELVQAYYEEVNTQQLMKKLKIQSWIRYIGVIIVATVIIVSLLRSFYLNKLYEEFKEAQPVSTEEIIEES
ncbi:MAG: DUF6120 family protein [Massilimicrobiota sp.]|nr:DUF6120 family protein [Massilimicrobiota sp.]